jgi:hypothetical protein
VSTRETRKPRPQLAESLFADPWRKLLALGLAVLLWLFLNSRIVRQDSLDFGLQAVDVAAGPGEREDDARLTLAVRISLRDYTVRGFYSRIDSKSIEKVQLHFEGPRYLIDRLTLQSSRFEARPSPDSFTERSCEFDVRNVHASNSELQGLLVRMEPRVIKVELERNQRAEVPLRVEHVDVLAPDPAVDADFGKRLGSASVEFHPLTVTLFGPIDSLQAVVKEPKLFEVDLSGEGRTNETALMKPLKLLGRHHDLGIRVEDPQPYVTYHLPPQFRTFTMSVPVQPWVIPTPGGGRDDYVLEPQLASIQLRAAKLLENELSVKEDAKSLDAWASENLLLLVRIRPSAEKEWSEQPILVWYGGAYKKGVDWLVEHLPAIKVTRKAQ